MLTSLQIWTSTTLRNMKWQIETSAQYLHVYFNESGPTNVVSRIIFMSFAQNICLQYKHKHVDVSPCRQPDVNKQRYSDCALVLDASFQFIDIWILGMLWRTFPAEVIDKSIWRQCLPPNRVASGERWRWENWGQKVPTGVGYGKGYPSSAD